MEFEFKKEDILPKLWELYLKPKGVKMPRKGKLATALNCLWENIGEFVHIDDIKKLRSPIKKLMIEWVFDDKNKNILYKNDGDERYPDFKLYKMIARTVHNHTPQKVLNKEVFEKYQIARKKINNKSAIFNIDELPIMT